MFVLKQCKCGCTHFEREPDDDVLRCADCWSLAEFVYVKEKPESEVRKLNAKQRTRLENIVSELEDIVSDEQEKLDNLEENFSGTERYERIEEGIFALEEAIESLQNIL